MSRQMLRFGHPQVRNGDEIGCGAETSGRALGLLEKSVHRFDEGVRTAVGHTAHDRLGALTDRLGQLPGGSSRRRAQLRRGRSSQLWRCADRCSPPPAHTPHAAPSSAAKPAHSSAPNAAGSASL